MKRFFYKVRQVENGLLLEGYIKANTKQEAAICLRKEQYLIIELKSYDIPIIFKSLYENYKKRKIDIKFWVILCRQLSILLSSGLNITDAFKILHDGAKDDISAKFFGETLEKLQAGKSLSQTWTEMNVEIPTYIISSLVVAQHTGLLTDSLNGAANVLQRIYEEERKVKQICIYPVFLLMILSIICSIMIFFVLPIFEVVFQKMNLELPLLTKTILFVGNFIRYNLVYIFSLVGILTILLIKYWRNDKFRLRIFIYLFKLPVIGALLEKIYLLQIGRQLNFLLSSGMNINDSMDVICSSMKNIYILECLNKIRQDIHRGLSLCKSFKNAGIRNYIFLGLLDVGEQTGMLVNNLKYAVEFLEKEIDGFVNEFMKILEPALMVVVGIIVGIFVLSIILPLFSIVNGFSL